MHVSAEFLCASDTDCAIRGSFFFDPGLCPPIIFVGDTVELVDIKMQEWNGSAQLSGKNVSIFHVQNQQQQQQHSNITPLPPRSLELGVHFPYSRLENGNI